MVRFIAFIVFCFPGICLGLSHPEVQPPRVDPGEEITVSVDRPDWVGKDVYIHYGFNGWNLKFPEATGADNLGNIAYYHQVLMTRNGSKFSKSFKVPEEGRALHFAFCLDDCFGKEWDNNFGADYSWPIAFPYIGPILTWGKDQNPATDIAISFESSWPAEGWLKYRVKSGRWKTIRASRAYFHRFRLVNLKSNATYQYQIGVGTTHRSKTYEFKVPDRSRIKEKVSFIVVGDMQDSGENGMFSQVAAQISLEPDVDFILSPGDLPWNDLPGDWWTFFDKAKDMLASKVFMPVVGNHDTPYSHSHKDVSSFMKYFDLPDFDQQKTWYEFSFGSASFLGLNSERPKEFASDGIQLSALNKWLDSRSEKSSWNFLCWHIAPFNVGARHWGQQFDFRDAASILSGSIDWVFNGHEHLYQRFLPIDYDKSRIRVGSEYGPGEQTVGYMIIPPAGAFPNDKIVSSDSRIGNLRNMLAFPKIIEEKDTVQSDIGYVRVDIEGNQLRMATYGYDGTRFVQIDSLEYSK